MSNIFEITSDMQQLQDAEAQWAADHDGDISDFPYKEEYESLEGAREDKLLNTGAYVRSTRLEAKKYLDEAKRLIVLGEALNSRADSREKLIDGHLSKGEALKDTRCSLFFTPSHPVELDVPVSDLPEHLLLPSPERKPDKKAIKAMIKSEEGCKFAHRAENFNLQIK